MNGKNGESPEIVTTGSITVIAGSETSAEVIGSGATVVTGVEVVTSSPPKRELLPSMPNKPLIGSYFCCLHINKKGPSEKNFLMGLKKQVKIKLSLVFVHSP